ncbi:non-structural maintenance of chromosomes element 3 homolog [Diretmus argenteus]
MPKRKKLAKTPTSSQSKTAAPRHSDSLQDEDDDMTFSQPTTSQLQKRLEMLTPAQVAQKTAEVVQYFVVKEQKKVPVRRADIVKYVVKEYRNVYTEIMKRVAHTFDQVFGLKLVEYDTKNHIYMLINKLDTVEAAPFGISSKDPKKMTLLFAILGIVFMKGGAVKENLIWKQLKKLGIDPGEKHEEFGNVKKLVTDEFVRQRYLELVRIPHTDPFEYEFRWGQRAELEVSKEKILEFMGQMFDQDPRVWTQQYKEATQANSAHADSAQASTSSQK